MHVCVNTLLELHKMNIKNRINIKNWMTIKKKALKVFLLSGLRMIKKEGGFLLSRIELQYHRRKWA